MRSLAFWVLLFVALSAAIIGKSNSVSDSVFTYHEDVYHEDVMTMDHGGASAPIGTRKLKERSYDVSTATKNRDLGSINQEDYPCFDPSPSSKASINSGPIEHGTPLMPYVMPPAHPRHGSPP